MKMTIKKDISDEKWIRLMEIGRRYGCHQMPERSFFVNGRQLPLCARCTGVAVGQTTAFFILLLGFKTGKKSVCYALTGSGIMLADWLLQHFEIKQSTNTRRFATGAVCGFGLAELYFEGIRFLFGKIFARKKI